MKTIKFILPIIAAIAVLGCKKEYACVCSNPGGSTVVFKVKGTHEKATTECNDYYNQNYSSVPWNETSCAIK